MAFPSASEQRFIGGLWLEQETTASPRRPRASRLLPFLAPSQDAAGAGDSPGLQLVLELLLELLFLRRQDLHPLLQLAQFRCPLLRGHRRNGCLSRQRLRPAHLLPGVELMASGEAQRAGGGLLEATGHHTGTARWRSQVPWPCSHP